MQRPLFVFKEAVEEGGEPAEGHSRWPLPDSDSHDITGHLIVTAIYAVAGAIVAIQANRLWQCRGVPGDAFDIVS
jgi:hypothetical protein